MAKRRLYPVTSWRDIAFDLYRKLYGRRCVKCSHPVEKNEAVLYRMSGSGDEVILAHRRCKP